MNTEQKQKLLHLFSLATSRLSARDYHQFHLETVNNYITHFTRLSIQQQDKVFSILNEYLSLIIEDSEIRNENSYILFEKYIMPLISVYEKRVGFAMHVRWWITLCWFLALQLVTLLFFRTIVAMILIALLFLMYYTFFSGKKKTRQVQGYLY
jgi:hypothetical protein